jgi:hypothetical protein
VPRASKRLLLAGGLTASIVLAPAAVLAATGTFSSGTPAAAVSGVNTSNAPGASAVVGRATGAHGTGVSGAGRAYGVFSNGPLGIAPGQPLTCTGCISYRDLGTLPAGQSESGVYGAGGSGPTGWLSAAITFPVPLRGGIAANHVYDVSYEGASGACPGAGRAAPGWLCLYGQVGDYNAKWIGDVYSAPAYRFGSPDPGVVAVWSVDGGDPQVGGTWTLTAP